MKKKPTVLQLAKYDITQKIVEELADAESRTIVFSIVREARTADELSRAYKIPISTVYNKLKSLEKLSLVYVAKYWITDHGKRIKFYKSRIRMAKISIHNSVPILHLIPN
ncbi:MAG: TrmB family transcriptional regulator [Thaumarchaeota archaeon]|nr:TrmB family transcriptional regulator [Nitrososphaerota archaeon]